MKKVLWLVALCCGLLACSGERAEEPVAADRFVRIEGPDLVCPDGSKLLIRGTNLGNLVESGGIYVRFQQGQFGGPD